MNILFLTIGRMNSVEDHGLYTDLLRYFRDQGHKIYSVSAREKRLHLPTELIEDHGILSLKVQVGNITKCGIVEKGISTVLIERQYLKAIKKHLCNVRFDLILYSTPPITLVGVIQYVKKRDHARTYLLLKDIFPQNAVDLGLMKEHGLSSVLYRYFKIKEKKLYKISDRIGCMSQANVEYLCRHNPWIDPEIVEVCPNCSEYRDMRVDEETRRAIRKEYGIPEDRVVFVYGGNLGKPQGIPFLIDCIKAEADDPLPFFVIVGDGTEYASIDEFCRRSKPSNTLLIRSLPKDVYDTLVASCDVGMIFLDHRFTIPNFPSRLLPYMQAGLPVFACTDPNTDVGKVITENKFGWWIESNSVEAFSQTIGEILLEGKDARQRAGDRARSYLADNFTVERAYQTITR